MSNRPLKNYCARLCGVELSLKMLMYYSYTALFIRCAHPFGASLRLLLRCASFRLIDQRSCYCVAPCDPHGCGKCSWPAGAGVALAVARYIFQRPVARFSRGGLSLLLPLALGACQNMDALKGLNIQGVDLGRLVSAGQNIGDMGAKSEDEELLIGAKTASLLLEQAPLVNDPAVQAYVNLVGGWVAQNSERPELVWHFAVLNNKAVGAYAAPGGYVFITSGMLAQLNSEAELAGVLAHEVAHVVRKHHLQAIQQHAGVGLLSNLSVLAVQTHQAASGSPAVGDTQSNEKFEQLVSNVYTRGLDRGDEYEADAMGAVIATRAGYDSYGLATALQGLASMKQDDASLLTFLKVHPNIGDRLTQLQPTYVYLDRLTARGSQLTLDDRYLQTVSGRN
jgi:predicted Zn-dependent protease